MNFLPQNQSYLRDVAKAIIPYKVIMGGPDILPYRIGLQKIAYPLYREFRSSLPLFCSAQWSAYRHHKNDTRYSKKEIVDVHKDGYLSMEDIFLFARDQLSVNYVFWDHKYDGKSKGEHTYEDAIKVIRKYPTFNTATRR